MQSFIEIVVEQFENSQWYERIRLLRNVRDWSIKEGLNEKVNSCIFKGLDFVGLNSDFLFNEHIFSL